ncbi:MAG: hypothetical protein K2P63_01130, partial [Lachnospiraceae bacterium]|nr:hypothetical protein [Lachnospiraceae bacterium]
EKNWNFQGTDKDFIVSTGKLDNPKGTFVPSPFARKVTPSNSGYLTCGKTYHVTLVFNEQLVEIEGEKLGYEVTVTDGVTGAEKSVIKNLKWDGDRTVEFDFTPSDQEADNYAGYTFQITGLQGKGSLKAPDGVTFFAKIKRAICAYRSEGIYLNLGAKPQLLEPSDIFCGDWVNDHGEQLKNVKNIVLTASKPELKVETPSKEQTDQMVDKIKNEVKTDGYTVEKSATYDLRLMTCNQNVIQTGMSVRLHIGFPEGFGPDDEGVTFKAYHFIKKDGKITGVEELECIVGEKGLIVTCYSFSPFAIVALSGGEAQETTDQKLLIMSSAGGDVKFKGDDKDRICTLSEKGQSKTVEIKANPGYVISGVYLNDKGQKVTNKSSMNVTVKYEALDGESNILDVVFAKDSPQSAAPSTPDKPSDTTQQSSSFSGQSSSSGGQSSSSGSGSSTSSSSSAATGSAA